jgi:hypothetical protein
MNYSAQRIVNRGERTPLSVVFSRFFCELPLKEAILPAFSLHRTIDFSCGAAVLWRHFAGSLEGDCYELYASDKCVSGVCGIRIRSLNDPWNCSLKA